MEFSPDKTNGQAQVDTVEVPLCVRLLDRFGRVFQIDAPPPDLPKFAPIAGKISAIYRAPFDEEDLRVCFWVLVRGGEEGLVTKMAVFEPIEVVEQLTEAEAEAVELEALEALAERSTSEGEGDDGQAAEAPLLGAARAAALRDGRSGVSRGSPLVLALDLARARMAWGHRKRSALRSCRPFDTPALP